LREKKICRPGNKICAAKAKRNRAHAALAQAFNSWWKTVGVEDIRHREFLALLEADSR